MKRVVLRGCEGGWSFRVRVGVVGWALRWMAARMRWVRGVDMRGNNGTCSPDGVWWVWWYTMRRGVCGREGEGRGGI